MKNLLLEESIETIESLVNNTKDKEVTEAWSRIKKYVDAKEAISPEIKNNMDLIRHLDTPGMAALLSLDYQKAASFTKWINWHYKWLLEEPELTVEELNSFGEEEVGITNEEPDELAALNKTVVEG